MQEIIIIDDPKILDLGNFLFLLRGVNEFPNMSSQMGSVGEWVLKQDLSPSGFVPRRQLWETEFPIF